MSPRLPRIYNLGDPEISPSRSVSQNYDTIRRRCLSNGHLFEDENFSPGYNIDTRDGESKIVWLRPNRIATGCRELPVFVPAAEAASRFDAVQGELNDCWLIAAMANLTLNRELFALVVPPNQSFDAKDSYCGLFRFRFWRFGKWVQVVIDDRLPTRDGRLIFARSSRANIFWASLLEKAYAKLYGSYDALYNGRTSEAMVDLTGGLTEHLAVGSMSDADLWATIRQSFERGSLIGCCIESEHAGRVRDGGLVEAHAYSITNAFEEQRQRQRQQHQSDGSERKPQWMLQLRNPWNLASRHQSTGRFEPATDRGEFLIPFDEWARHFTRVDMCHLLPDAGGSGAQRQWRALMFEGGWIKGRTAGGSQPNNRGTFSMNPQYLIELNDCEQRGGQCTLIVALMHKSYRRFTENPAGPAIGFAIYELGDVGARRAAGSLAAAGKHLDDELFIESPPEPVASSGRPSGELLREVTGRFNLPAGAYVVIPFAAKFDDEAEFMLRVWTESARTTMLAYTEYSSPTASTSQPVDPSASTSSSSQLGQHQRQQQQPFAPSGQMYPQLPAYADFAYPNLQAFREPPMLQATYYPVSSQPGDFRYPSLVGDSAEPSAVQLGRIKPTKASPAFELKISRPSGAISKLLAAICCCSRQSREQPKQKNSAG